MALRSNNESGLVVVSDAKKLIFFRFKIVISCDAGLVNECAGKGHAGSSPIKHATMFLLRRIAMGGSHTDALEHSCFKGFVCKVLPKGILNLCLVITDAASHGVFLQKLFQSRPQK